jgi:hypothetical protein
MANEPRNELFRRYELVLVEYRSEVRLGWERQRLFITLSVVMTGFACVASSDQRSGAVMALVCAALTAVAGILVVLRSHARYRAVRVSVHQLEDQLGFADLRTTGGQRELRGGQRQERFRVVDVVVGLLGLLTALDVLLAVLLWTRTV